MVNPTSPSTNNNINYSDFELQNGEVFLFGQLFNSVPNEVVINNFDTSPTNSSGSSEVTPPSTSSSEETNAQPNNKYKKKRHREQNSNLSKTNEVMTIRLSSLPKQYLEKRVDPSDAINGKVVATGEKIENQIKKLRVVNSESLLYPMQIENNTHLPKSTYLDLAAGLYLDRLPKVFDKMIEENTKQNTHIRELEAIVKSQNEKINDCLKTNRYQAQLLELKNKELEDAKKSNN